MRSYTTSDFDFDLPPSLIAQHPAPERSAARLLDAHEAEAMMHRQVRDLPTLLRAGDLVVLNDTQVIRARLFGAKATGGRVEILVERVLPDGSVAAHLRVSKKPAVGAVLQMEGGFTATLLGRWLNGQTEEDAAGAALFHFRFSGDAYDLMARHGHIPLPPYIEHGDSESDAQRYQTVFARAPGAVAAPTAALHFDDALLAELRAEGLAVSFVTLHVGAGTFQPVKTEDLTAHTMHAERYSVPLETQEAISQCRARGGRVVAVGTTTLRSLESWAKTGAAEGDTRIFITPGFSFQVVDILLTNFHLPRSTLMMLVSAFAGYERIRAIYDCAIDKEYRFFSYGDAMLLSRENTPAGNSGNVK